MFAPIHSRVTVEDLIRGVDHSVGQRRLHRAGRGHRAAAKQNSPRLMTKRARELGLTKSTFGNASRPARSQTEGDGARTRRARAATSSRPIPEYYKIYGEREFTWNKIRQYNRNPLLAMNIGADGLKTGFTKEAGYGLVGSAVQNGLRLIVVVNGLKIREGARRRGRKLLDWGFRDFESRLLFAEGETIGEAKVYGGSQGRVPLVGRTRRSGSWCRAAYEKHHRARGLYRAGAAHRSRRASRSATLKVWRGDNMALEVPLQAARRQGSRAASPRRAFDAATELVIGLFRAGMQRL